MKKFINFNGEILEKNSFSLELSNRAFRFGDSIFETIRVFDGKIIFIEEHYSRLVNSLEILRISIPKFFTKEYLNLEILNLVSVHNLGANARIRFTVYRKSDDASIYFVDSNTSFDFVIEYSALSDDNFDRGIANYEIDVFDEIKKPMDVLSQIKTNNVLLHSIAGSVAIEKSINNIVLVNNNLCITEAVNSNIFIVGGGVISTPQLDDGCVNGIMRSNVISLINRKTNYELVVRSINVDELYNCDEVFLTNSIIGIQSVSMCNTTNYSGKVTVEIQDILKDNINSLKGQ